MSRNMLEKICDPHISIVENINILRENWLKRRDLDNATLYIHPLTYEKLIAENRAMCYMNARGDKIMGLPIKQDFRVRQYHLVIREEDNMEVNMDSLKITGDFYPNFGMGLGGLHRDILRPLPKRYIINDGAVILFWSDGTKTIVKRSEDDKFDPVKGFLWAYFQKHSGLSKTKANKYLRDLDYDYDKHKIIRF